MLDLYTNDNNFQKLWRILLADEAKSNVTFESSPFLLVLHMIDPEIVIDLVTLWIIHSTHGPTFEPADGDPMVRQRRASACARGGNCIRLDRHSQPPPTTRATATTILLPPFFVLQGNNVENYPYRPVLAFTANLHGLDLPINA
jgi:hypothetical protein